MDKKINDRICIIYLNFKTLNGYLCHRLNKKTEILLNTKF